MELAVELLTVVGIVVVRARARPTTWRKLWTRQRVGAVVWTAAVDNRATMAVGVVGMTTHTSDASTVDRVPSAKCTSNFFINFPGASGGSPPFNPRASPTPLSAVVACEGDGLLLPASVPPPPAAFARDPTPTVLPTAAAVEAVNMSNDKLP